MDGCEGSVIIHSLVTDLCCNFAQSFSACYGPVIDITWIVMSGDAAISGQFTTIPEMVIVSMVVF
jgi:hypothetical protein